MSLIVTFMVICFSSRRRHTISLCDWSSDVCSSDLLKTTGAGGKESKGESSFYLVFGLGLLIYMSVLLYGRSEERRVGKECGVGSFEMQYVGTLRLSPLRRGYCIYSAVELSRVSFSC